MEKEDEKVSLSHWGLFDVPKHEPEVQRKKIENLLFPIVPIEHLDIIA